MLDLIDKDKVKVVREGNGAIVEFCGLALATLRLEDTGKWIINGGALNQSWNDPERAGEYIADLHNQMQTIAWAKIEHFIIGAERAGARLMQWTADWAGVLAGSEYDAAKALQQVGTSAAALAIEGRRLLNAAEAAEVLLRKYVPAEYIQGREPVSHQWRKALLQKLERIVAAERLR